MRRSSGRRVFALAGVLALVTCNAALADEAPKSWWQLITLNAYASASYTWNFNDPQSNLNQLRAFDYDSNSIRIDAAELVVQKAVAQKGEFGFRVDVAFGAVAKVAAARGLFRDPTTNASLDIDLQQAFASYIVPLGHGLRVDVGKFVTPVGAEFIDGYDGYNDNFSRSFLFTLAIPFTHTGLKLTYPFNDKFAATVMVVNGWDNVLDNNAAKSFGVALAITPLAPLTIYLNYIGGPERDNDNTDFRHLVDAGVVYKPTPRWSFTVNADWGMDMNAIVPVSSVPTADTGVAAGGASPAASNAQWAGVAGDIRCQATRRFALIVRGEAFWDVDGFRTGTAQRLLEATLTPEVRITDGLLVRADARIDNSNQAVFQRSDGLLRHYQPTLGINALYVF
ncbi:MAG TPA: outer membrane beta-barrel protein [Polyangia bacterium]|nr:outer membrane beta-barrel protein [Polyangia bacterium]